MKLAQAYYVVDKDSYDGEGGYNKVIAICFDEKIADEINDRCPDLQSKVVYGYQLK